MSELAHYPAIWVDDDPVVGKQPPDCSGSFFIIARPNSSSSFNISHVPMLFVWARRGTAAVINRVLMVRFINAPASGGQKSSGTTG
jgi:hypothetical protein